MSAHAQGLAADRSLVLRAARAINPRAPSLPTICALARSV